MRTFKKGECFRYECDDYISWYKYSGEKTKKSKLLICESFTMYKDKYLDKYEIASETAINPMHLASCKKFNPKKFNPTKKAIGFLILKYCYE